MMMQNGEANNNQFLEFLDLFLYLSCCSVLHVYIQVVHNVQYFRLQYLHISMVCPAGE